MKSTASLFVALCFLSAYAQPPRVSGDELTELRSRIRREFPNDLSRVPVPENNPQTEPKIALGQTLFFDPNLSSCGTVACATCHLPERGFSDGERISDGCNGATGRRNSNTVYNNAFLSHLFWDGRVQSLEEQALGPVVDPVEMANTWDNVLKYLATGEHPVSKKVFPMSRAYYQKAFEEVFDGEITSTSVSKAIASYERTVVSRDSPFDRWLHGDDSAMTASQKQGALVFFGRGMCSDCHQPPNFTDSDFHNIGTPNAGFETAALFVHNKEICGGIAQSADPGRAETPFLRTSCSDVGRFKTPTLRNVELSGPYMHNGVFPTLDDVVRHYQHIARGTVSPLAGSMDKDVLEARLGDAGGRMEDIGNLVEFLKALSGTQLKSPEGGIAPPSAD